MPVAVKTKDMRGISPVTKTPYWYNPHNHTDFSNPRFRDADNTVPLLLKMSKAKGARGIAITDHGCLSGFVKVAKFADQHPDFFNGKDGKGPFKVVLGSEIYLDDANIIEHAVKNNDKTKFFHFVLTAQDDIGLHALRIISSNSWKLHIENIWNDDYDIVNGKKITRPHAFFFRGMRRIPTYKDWLQKLMFDPKFHFRGHVFAGTACLGSELSRCILTDDKPRAKRFIHYIEKTFGKGHCYFEMMPADNRHGQRTVNHALWNISHGNYFDNDTGKGIPCVISTDAHYIDNHDEHAHSTFLKSENPNRDVIDYYKYARTYTYNDLRKFFKPDVLKEATTNSIKLLSRYAPIWHLTNEPQMAKLAKANPKHPPLRMHYIQEIPESPAPKHIPRVDLMKYAKRYHIDWNKYPYFKLLDKPEKYIDPKTHKHLSPRTIRADKYYLYKIFKGMNKKHLPYDNKYLGALNWEFLTLHVATRHFNQPMSAYFLTVFYAVIDTCWHAGSIVGPGRGSCAEWLSNFVLDISAVNSLKWNLWQPRFLCPARVLVGNSQPDIDLDSESSKRPNIINVSRKKYGADRVLNFSVFDKQKAKSTIYDSCRGWQIPRVNQEDIANKLPPNANGMGSMSLHDAFFGNKKNGTKPVKDFISAVGRYPGLKNDMLHIDNTINGVGCHASGVAFFNEPLTQRNAMMRTNKKPGIPITQFSAHDSAYLSSLKYDCLTLSNLDVIHVAVDLLIDAGLIKKLYVPVYKTINGKRTYVGRRYSFHKTYMHYFGPQALDYTSKGMYDMLFKGEVTDAFEFSSIVGREALEKVHATDFSALVAANALMRLTVDPDSDTHESHMMKKYWGKEQPIDRYVRYRDNKGAWDKDMKHFGLTKHEMGIMHYFLDRHRGVCYSQEDLMKLDIRICYGVKDYLKLNPVSKLALDSYSSANTLRKAVAKKNPKILEEARQNFYNMGKKRGVRRQFLDYVWYNCAVPAKNYSFNLAHGVAYTMILIIEMNICYRFGPIFWQTACLTINSGLFGKNLKNPNYDKLDIAMSGLRGKIASPDINHSQLGFMPYHDKILFGLYPINGLSAKDAKTIIDNRKAHGPFKSFHDFIMRTKLTQKTNIVLIKSGAFDCFETNRVLLMANYIKTVIPARKRLTMRQVPKIVKHIPDKYRKLVELYAFRSELNSETKGRSTTPVSNITGRTFIHDYAKAVKPYAKVGQMSLLGGGNSEKPCWYDSHNRLHINCSGFERYYQKAVEPLRQWLKTDEAREAEADNRRKQLSDKYAPGNPNAWEMQSLGCYIHAHELSKTLLAQQYGITPDYTAVPKKPQVVYDFKVNDDRHPGKKREIKIFHHYFIYGTAISKNANKGLVYLLTPNGLANVYCGKWRYAIYNQRVSKAMSKRRGIPPKKSWFDRGTKLAILGYRSGNNFFANKAGAKDIVYEKQHPKTKHSQLKRYSECLYRIAGYGPDAKLVTITNRQGVQNPLPTKNTHIDKYASSQQILKHNQQRKQKATALRQYLKDLVAKSPAPDDNGTGHKGTHSFTRDDELQYLHHLSALIQICKQMR